MSASSFPFFSVKRSFDMRMHAIRDRGQPALARYSYPGRYMEKHLLKDHSKVLGGGGGGGDKKSEAIFDLPFFFHAAKTVPVCVTDLNRGSKVSFFDIFSLQDEHHCACAQNLCHFSSFSKNF